MIRHPTHTSRYWQAQARTIWALMLREVITRYGRHNIGFLWLLGEPMLFTAGIALAWSFGSSIHGHKIGVLEFAITGYSSVLLWRNCANRAINGIQPNLTLLVHRPVKVLDIFLSRSFLEIAGATLSFAFISVPLVFLGYMAVPYDMLQLIVAWILLSWTGLSMALVIGPISELSELLERVWHIVTYLLFPLSGAIYMVAWLTPGMQKIVLWIPMVHGLEMLRGAYYGPAVQVFYDPWYVVTFCAIATLCGLLLTRFLVPRLQAR